MLECIREFHKHGFVHRDVKPGNFLLKLGPTNPLALIDFGLARVFIDEATGRPFPESAQTAFHGTVTYASVNAQLFHDQSPRDDLVSWLYSLVELAEGYLPWSADSDPTVIQNRKVAISDRTLMRSLPREFQAISIYLGTLKYASKVNYDYIFYLVIHAIKTMPDCQREPFDWENLSQQEILEFSGTPTLPKAKNYAGELPHIEYPLVDPKTEDADTCACTVA
jgi:serine/threonine protein kinase